MVQFAITKKCGALADGIEYIALLAVEMFKRQSDAAAVGLFSGERQGIGS